MITGISILIIVTTNNSCALNSPPFVSSLFPWNLAFLLCGQDLLQHVILFLLFSSHTPLLVQYFSPTTTIFHLNHNQTLCVLKYPLAVSPSIQLSIGYTDPLHLLFWPSCYLDRKIPRKRERFGWGFFSVVTGLPAPHLPSSNTSREYWYLYRFQESYHSTTRKNILNVLHTDVFRNSTTVSGVEEKRKYFFYCRSHRNRRTFFFLFFFARKLEVKSTDINIIYKKNLIDSRAIFTIRYIFVSCRGETDSYVPNCTATMASFRSQTHTH